MSRFRSSLATTTDGITLIRLGSSMPDGTGTREVLALATGSLPNSCSRPTSKRTAIQSPQPSLARQSMARPVSSSTRTGNVTSSSETMASANSNSTTKLQAIPTPTGSHSGSTRRTNTITGCRTSRSTPLRICGRASLTISRAGATRHIFPKADASRATPQPTFRIRVSRSLTAISGPIHVRFRATTPTRSSRAVRYPVSGPARLSTICILTTGRPRAPQPSRSQIFGSRQEDVSSLCAQQPLQFDISLSWNHHQISS